MYLQKSQLPNEHINSCEVLGTPESLFSGEKVRICTLFSHLENPDYD